VFTATGNSTSFTSGFFSFACSFSLGWGTSFIIFTLLPCAPDEPDWSEIPNESSTYSDGV